MKTLLHTIEENLKNACEKAGFSMAGELVRLDRPKTLEHGHFSSNLAMVLGKKNGLNPRQAAEKIIENLDPSQFEKVEIAGPGFINFWIEQKNCSKEANSMVKNMEKYLEEATQSPGNGKTAIIEYSSPNIAKPLGVHHLLSTILGESLKRILGALQYKTISDNYLGDLGTQFGKLIYAIKTWGDLKAIEKDPINELLKLYVKFHEEAEKDPALEDQGRAEYLKYEKGDQENRDWWKKIVAWSMLEIDPLYERLGVQFDFRRGESFYEDKMPALLEKGRKSGVFIDGKEGAWIVPMDNPDEPPALVKRSDGATLYLTRDLAQVEYLEKTHHPDVMLWVVDVAQSLHFRQRFEVAHKLGLTKAQLVHVIFGRMEFAGSAMSTRKGKVIRLSDLLDEAQTRAEKLVAEKASSLSPGEQKELARILGIGSIKYNVLHQNRIQNISFDWDKMLSFEGNSAPYLLYTATRSLSVLKKAGVSEKETVSYALVLSDPKEVEVWLMLLTFADSLKRAGEEYKPNHIANHLYGLAQAYNALYNALPILQAEKAEKESRLLLTHLVHAVMEKGLGLLGLEIPEKM